MRPQWPILCLALLLVTPASTLAGDFRLLNAGVRGGVGGFKVFGGGEDEDFQQYDLFATASLPWSTYGECGWGFSTRLMGTAGVLIGAGEEGFVGAIVPLLAFGPKDSALALDVGVGVAGMTRQEFGEQNFGGAFEFVLTFGLSVPVYRAFGIGYRMGHLSDASIYGGHGRGHPHAGADLPFRGANVPLDRHLERRPGPRARRCRLRGTSGRRSAHGSQLPLSDRRRRRPRARAARHLAALPRAGPRRAIRIEKDDEGIEVLLVEPAAPRCAGTLGALGGIGMDATDLMTLGQRSYEDGCPPGGYDPAARLAVMDDEKIDVALLYPTIGIAWEGLVETLRSRPHTAGPTTAGSSTSAPRPPPARADRAHLPHGPEGRRRGGEARAEGRLRRRLPLAGSAVARRPPIRRRATSSRSGRRCRTSTCRSRSTSSRATRARSMARWERPAHRRRVVFAFAFLALDVMAAFTSMMTRGLFENYPRLRCAVLEAGSNWITAWLDRLDHKSEVMRAVLADEAAAVGVLQAPVPDLRRARRVAHGRGRPAPRRRLRRLGLGLSAPRRVVQRRGQIRERIAGLPEAAQRKSSGERAAVLRARRMSEPRRNCSSR